LAAFAEIGLTGRLRPATQGDRRVEECGKLGLHEIVVAAGSSLRGKLGKTEAETLRQAIRHSLVEDRGQT
jgi:predicted ATP-dependent serine protease